MLQNVWALRAAAALLAAFARLDGLLLSFGVFAVWPVQIGIFAVAVFFTLSSFIMVYTTSNHPIAPWTFRVNRIVRVVPMYRALTLVLCVVALTEPTLLQATRPDGVELLKSLTLIPFKKANGQIEPFLFVGWSLNYEIFFYLIFAAGLEFRSNVLGSVCVILSTIFLVVPGLHTWPAGVVGRFYTNPIILEFALGMLAALMLPYIAERAGPALKGFVTALIATAFGAAMLLPHVLPETSSVIASGLHTAVIIVGTVTLERWGLMVQRPSLLLLLGNASYSIYLTQPFVTQMVGKIAQRLNSHRLLPQWCCCLRWSALAFWALSFIGSWSGRFGIWPVAC